jgi:WD40 repeat protein
MQRWILTCVFLVPAFGLVRAQESKYAIPSSAALTKAEALIQELYKDEFTKARGDNAAKSRLAQTLLQEGKDTTDLVAGRYRLLVHARDLASAAGDGPTALQAIEELSQGFRLPARDVFAMKIDALASASKTSNTSDAHQTVLDSALVLLEDALALDDFAAATQLLATAEAAGRKLRNVPLVAGIRKRQDEVAALQKEYARWQPFAEKLASQPDDAQANLEMGKYHALIKGNWERGLPLLEKGAGPLQQLAKMETVVNPASKAALSVGDRWRQVTQSLPETMRPQALLRAYYWYQNALADPNAASTGDIEKRLQAVTELLPAELRVGEIAGELKKCEGHIGPVYGGAFAPDGKRAVSASADGSLRLWDTKTGKELRRLDGHSGRVWCVAFASDGRRVVSGGFDGSVRVWDLISGREMRRFAHNDYVRSVVFSHDGHYVLSGGDDKVIRLWSLDTGKEVRSFKGHDHFVWDVALARDGKRALSASLDKTVRLWNVDTGAEIKRLTGHQDTVLSVAFSPEGRRALSGSTDKTLKLWNLETGEALRSFTGHKGYVHSVAFSPDGRRVLSAGQDNTVRLWDALTGDQLRVLEGHRDQVWQVDFSRDGRLALSSSQDSSLRVWGSAR